MAKAQPTRGYGLAHVLCAGVLTLGLAAPCNAGAWLQPEGQGQIIFNPSVLTAKHRFDRTGKQRPTDRFLKQDNQTLIDYGWRNDVTLVLMSSQRIEVFSYQTADQRVVTSALGGGARIELFRQDSFVLSGQLTGSWHLERQLPVADRRFGPRIEADARLLAGYSFDLGGMSAFMEAQAGYRWRSGHHADEVRLDLTLGVRPIPRVLLLLQAFNSAGLAREGDARIRQHKLQATVVLELTQTWAIQGGVFSSLAGRNALKERGVLVGVWRKF